MATARKYGCLPNLQTDGSHFTPIAARTVTAHHMVGPVSYNCVKLMVVRSGSAVLLSEFGEHPVRAGDVILLGANVLCGSEPEGYVTTTVIYLDTDYLVDQLFWQHAGQLHDRLDAQDLAETIYTEPFQVMRLGEDHVETLAPWLDELVQLSLDEEYSKDFHQIQALWFLIINEVAPHIQVTPIRSSPTQRARSRPTIPRGRTFSPSRQEAVTVHDLLHQSMSRPWTLAQLAGHVHMSTKQLTRVFADAFGKTPLAYLTMLRVEEMARLLRETDMTVAQAGRTVGWKSRSRACEAFLECTGVSPSHYRRRQQSPLLTIH